MFTEAWFWIVVAIAVGVILLLGWIGSSIEKSGKLKKEAEAYKEMHAFKYAYTNNLITAKEYRDYIILTGEKYGIAADTIEAIIEAQCPDIYYTEIFEKLK